LQASQIHKIAIVIDTNVLIKHISLPDILPSTGSDFSDTYEVHTIKEVLRELRDESARNYAATQLPYELIVHDYVEEEYMDRVRAFAKETGDLKTLSETDMRVMALGLQLNEERGEGDRVQKEPKPLAEFRPKRFIEDYKRGESDSSDSGSSSEEEQSRRLGKNPKEGEGFDDFQEVKQKKHGDRKDHIKPQIPKVEAQEVKPVIETEE